ncbi:MAG: CoA transferase [Betaproteobacteria bacterium]|nr:CoA transferase [Betaproteobacteria bacterium]
MTSKSRAAAKSGFEESPYQVVEVTTTHAGAYAGRQLAEAGLPVLRLELLDKPGQQLPPMTSGGFSAPYLSLNGKKENVRVNGASAPGREFLARIIANSSVFVTDVPDLFTARSALVTCRLHVDSVCVAGDLPSNDILVQAMSGALSMTGRLEGAPTPIGIPVGDVAPGLFAAIGVLFALVEEIPQTISIHSLDATVSLLSYLGCSFLVSGAEPGFAGSGHPFVTPYGAYRAKDGYIIVAPGFTQVFWQNLCRMLGRSDLIDDPRFRTFTNRKNNRADLQKILSTAFAENTVEEWEARLDQADVPNGPVRSFRQALEHPVTNVRGMITQVHGLPFLNTPLINNTPMDGMADRPLGARGWRQALGRLGMTGADVAALGENGIVSPGYTPFSQPTETEVYKGSTPSQTG